VPVSQLPSIFRKPNVAVVVETRVDPTPEPLPILKVEAKPSPTRSKVSEHPKPEQKAHKPTKIPKTTPTKEQCESPPAKNKKPTAEDQVPKANAEKGKITKGKRSIGDHSKILLEIL
jgi:hypothetical protein